MNWEKLQQIAFIPVAAFAALLLVGGYFMPDLRQALIYQPRANRIEAAMDELATRQRGMLRVKGRFQSFASNEAPPHLKTLGVDLVSWPSEDFLFEASVQPNKHLRLRALPRPASVRDLRVNARMYVADISPAGAVTSRGWYP
jgi:hypothetical protein